MASGFRKSRGGDEYVFVDGRAVRASEIAVPGAAEAAAMGRGEAAAVPGAAEAGAKSAARVSADANARPSAVEVMREMERDDAFALRDDAGALGIEAPFAEDDRRKIRRKYLAFGLVLLACCLVSFCADPTALAFRSPVEVVQGVGVWFSLAFTQAFAPADYADLYVSTLEVALDYSSVVAQILLTFKYALCGILLAISGMLYQNAFRNPIAAPSMLGVTNGINFAVLVLVLVYGSTAYQQVGLYYIFSFVGGVAVLALVMLGGKWTGRKGGFNVVNMILVGTIFSQLLGVLITFAQTNFLSDADWEAYERLISATTAQGAWMFGSLIVGTLAALVPVFLFRFRLNLVSFSDEETKFLGVDPTRLRLLALGCGSLMILTAQINAGQIAMLSLVVPFVVRAVFGSEFRKQLVGNLLVGSSMLVVCNLLASFIIIDKVGVGLASVTTIVALPLFVWMLAIRQRSWD